MSSPAGNKYSKSIICNSLRTVDAGAMMRMPFVDWLLGYFGRPVQIYEDTHCQYPRRRVSFLPCQTCLECKVPSSDCDSAEVEEMHSASWHCESRFSKKALSTSRLMTSAWFWRDLTSRTAILSPTPPLPTPQPAPNSFCKLLTCECCFELTWSCLWFLSRRSLHSS